MKRSFLTHLMNLLVVFLCCFAFSRADASPGGLYTPDIVSVVDRYAPPELAIFSGSHVLPSMPITFYTAFAVPTAIDYLDVMVQSTQYRATGRIGTNIEFLRRELPRSVIITHTKLPDWQIHFFRTESECRLL